MVILSIALYLEMFISANMGLNCSFPVLMVIIPIAGLGEMVNEEEVQFEL